MNQESNFDPNVIRDFSVGSEAYNAPELWKLDEQDECYRLNNLAQK
jgi:hypothetical protein